VLFLGEVQEPQFGGQVFPKAGLSSAKVSYSGALFSRVLPEIDGPRSEESQKQARNSSSRGSSDSGRDSSWGSDAISQGRGFSSTCWRMIAGGVPERSSATP
jgi:hypothetical protein